MIRTYSELQSFDTFIDRYNYLKLRGMVGTETFGFDRFLNQKFYGSPEWKKIRDFVILRDDGCDLGVDGFAVNGRIIIHHLNPITLKDLSGRSDFLLNPEFLICTSHVTHNAIHFGDENLLPILPTARTQNDTCPWKK